MSVYKNLVKSLKSKQLHIRIPFILFMIYTVIVYISIFIKIFNVGLQYRPIIEQWVDFHMYFTPQWIISSSGWPAVIIKVLWSTLWFMPTLLATITGAMIIFTCLAYLFGFIGHFFLFLKKWILDMQGL